MSIPRVQDRPAWDERRNTSRTFAVPPTALPDALRSLASFRRTAPRHAEWIAAGAPPIRSQADHVRWFGGEHDSKARRKR